MAQFEATWESLQQYNCPQWFRDAKFGIWAHWGPQCFPMVGDWYARNMYIEGHQQYDHHVRTYGHPSKFGYKDIVKLWKAEKFDPEGLMDLYKNSGAKYFVSMAIHHDNFDLWDSKHHNWNATKMGPGRDVVGEWAKAARAAGLRFGVTEHLERTYSWFNTNKGSDKTGPYAGVPYDGNDPEYADFYVEQHDDTLSVYPENPSEAWTKHWQARIMDLIDQHDPDLLYTDGGVPFQNIGREMVAHLYNRSVERRGQLESVYALKDPRRHQGTHPEHHGSFVDGFATLDVERGVIDGISDEPWQTDTCLGGWFYDSRREYKTPEKVVHMLADIVSKNGNLLLNAPQRPDGTLDDQCEWIVKQIGAWMSVNGEAIYETRPWKVYGEGPTTFAASTFAEKEEREFTGDDFRFTSKGDTIYAIAMGKPVNGGWLIRSLAGHEAKDVALLGIDSVNWQNTPAGLWVEAPASLPCEFAWSIRVDL